MDEFDLFDEMYEQWVDNIINTQPFTTTRLNDFQDIINVNQQIVNNIYNIRRHFEFNYENENYSIDGDGIDDGIDDSIDSDINVNNFQNLQNSFVDDIFNILNESINDTINQEFEDVKVTLTPEQFENFKNELKYLKGLIHEKIGGLKKNYKKLILKIFNSLLNFHETLGKSGNLSTKYRIDSYRRAIKTIEQYNKQIYSINDVSYYCQLKDSINIYYKSY